MNALFQQPGGENEQAAMQKLQELQVKDTLRMINNMVELCFSECVSSFRQKALTSSEEKCVSTCAEKFLKHSGRVGQRFGELWMVEQQQQAAAAANPGSQ
jgi:import inner membrane translocase subunit TIM9